MKIDNEYLNSILGVLLNSDKSTFDLNDLKSFWDAEEKEHKFVFHMEILSDQKFIERSDKEEGIGIRRSSDCFLFSIMPLRLTSAGHDFAAALNKPGVIRELSSSFSELGPSETVNAVFKLGLNIFENQLEKLTDR